MAYQRVVIDRGSPLPVVTAAGELARELGAEVVERSGVRQPGAGEIVLKVGEEARRCDAARSRLSGLGPDDEWELVVEYGGGLLICGSSARNACRASLMWLSAPERVEGTLSTFDFRERFTQWDNTFNQWYRHTRGFDRERHIRELARMGHTGIEVNRYLLPRGWHVRNREFDGDSYAWYMNYCPALDAFVETSLIEGIYPAEDLERNLDDLRESARLALSWGMVPGFVAYEPRGVSEEVFRRHPQLRGSRIDHPGRSLQPRYALDIAHPRVLRHYSESVTRLMEHVPELRYFVFWTGDSGSGLPFAEKLYAGPNGSYLARSKTLGQMAADFSAALLEGGRKVNPDFEVIMELSWEYYDDEREEITAALPDGVTLAHPTGTGTGVPGGQKVSGNDTERYGDDRAAGKEPYGEIVVSSWWDFEPVFGIPFPTILASKFDTMRELGLEQFFNRGGICAAPQCQWQVNHEVFAWLIGGGDSSRVKEFIGRVALGWCDGDDRQAGMLVNAWENCERAISAWPVLNWYQSGPGPTQGRWITRPLVPDFSLLTIRERSAFAREVFTLEWDIARQNLAFEGGLRHYTEEAMEGAVEQFDSSMLPLLELSVSILDQAIEIGERPVLVDQRDRFRGLLLLNRTVRNSFAAQAAINRSLLGQNDPRRQKEIMREAIQAEITNTEQWIEALTSSRTNFFHITDWEETPFLYKSPVRDLELRLEVMRRHLDDEPGPDLPELRAGHNERSAWRRR